MVRSVRFVITLVSSAFEYGRHFQDKKKRGG